MPPGRPRKPLGQKIQDGTYRPDRDGPLDSLVRADGEPCPPADLNELALSYWQQIVPGLVKLGIVAACDSHALALMCWWLAEMHRLRMTVDAVRAAGGAPNAQIYTPLGIATDKFNQLAARFGLTPSDRAKLRVEPPAGASATPVPPRQR